MAVGRIAESTTTVIRSENWVLSMIPAINPNSDAIVPKVKPCLISGGAEGRVLNLAGARDTAWAMSQESIWHLNIGFVGSGEDGGRANEIIITARKRGKPVYGEGPWWSVAYENVESREAALAALSNDLDEIDPGWRDVLEIR
jgi:hypothetical protein